MHLIQEHIPPPPQVTPPSSPSELERAQQLPRMLKDKARLDKKYSGGGGEGQQGKACGG